MKRADGTERCDTVGCRRDARVALRHVLPYTGGETAVMHVCPDCADGYTRRPVLRAELVGAL